MKGTADHIEIKESSTAIYVDDVSIQLDTKTTHSFKLSHLIIYNNFETPHVNPGNIIYATGSLSEFNTPTNPGQFNIKEYYKEKNIYYSFTADTFDILHNSINPYKTFLIKVKSDITAVYKHGLPDKEAGIVTAMLLGEKTLLDMDIRQLYQESGIGHLLAISGLHITILCMALYKFLLYMKMPKSFSIYITILFLYTYGSMTGFSISTSRAVLMMIISLTGTLLGRAYDMPTALCLSAIIIIIQKPFAFFSCSFLLSFAAVAAIIILQPALRHIILPNEDDYRFKKGQSITTHIRILLINFFLTSLSIQLLTLPIIQYFYYEFPTYGILLNLIVIPIASLLVILTAAAGILGIFFTPVSDFLLGGSYYILKLYELLCNAFEKLPFHTIISGRPKHWQIIIYYLCIIIIIAGAYLIDKIDKYPDKKIPFTPRISLMTILIFTSIYILSMTIYPHKLVTTFLDVGQGDGICIRSPSGTTYMIDGGSTDTSDIGRYRIIPFLKYNGINHIDYWIMTHSDEDHTSGMREVIEQSDTGNISVKHLILPNPDDISKDENYNEIVNLAATHHVSISYINTWDSIDDDNLHITCLHPDSNFVTDSANAYSTVLSLRYGDVAYLLTGDIEGDGEEKLTNILSSHNPLIPDRYDILKVAHHGSRNSSTDNFLSNVNPRFSIISAGKNNHYGHPHKELLARLNQIQSTIIRTDEHGAITITSDGTTIHAQYYRILT